MPRLRLTQPLLLALFALFTLGAVGRTQAELRGTWVARDGLGTRQKIISTLDQLAAANCNLVCVNVWSRGYTIHPSDVLFATCGQRQDPSFLGRDPLAEFILEAHRRGIEVEAWFEYGFMFGWSGWFAGPSGVGPVLTANPSWIARDQNGNSQVPDGGSGFFTWAIHEHPAVRQFLIDLAVEVVDRYDVDGIQFDRVRYPSTSFGYDTTTSAAYRLATGQWPPTNTNLNGWKRWRADGLTNFVTQLHNAVKARRSNVRVTNAPIILPLAYDSFLQDWPDWLVVGALDLVYPQVYRTTLSSYTATLDQQLLRVRSIDRGRIAPGIRAVSGTPTSAVLGMVAANRTRNLPGHLFWYAEGLYDDLPQLTANYFQTPAAVPLRNPGHRPLPIEREESDPSTVITGGFLPLAVSGSNGGIAAVSLPSAGPTDNVRFTLPVSETGLWRVLTHVPTSGGFANQTPHTVLHNAGEEIVLVDQGTTTVGWNELGTYWLSQGSMAVEVGTVPGQFTVADTIALLRSRFDSGAMSTIGAGTTGSAGTAALSLTGRASLAGSLRLQAASLPAVAPCIWALGIQPGATPVFGGALHVTPLVTSFALADLAGRTALELALPSDAGFRGLQILAQLVAIDGTATGGAVLTNAVQTTMQ
ncbi:MAG: family 10 glycosylhydrolase [bacterium]|nr:family 10 glycosylhydrolase [bacterium]